MKKGQISADLLLTLIVVIITITALGAIVLNYSEAQERSRVQQQLQYTANKTASIITATQALEDTTFTITTQIAKITFIDESKNTKKVYPNIRVVTNPTPLITSLEVSLSVRGINQSATAQFYVDSTGPTPNTIVTPNTNGTVVIRRA